MGTIGEHAVVLGASMAGMMAARVLTDAYQRVTVLERDELPTTREPRRGVPQGRQVHVILARGAAILDEMFPGILDALVADGTPVIRNLSEVRFCPGGQPLCHVERPRPMSVYQPSRPHLEYHVRRRLGELTGVAVLDRCEVVGFAGTPGGGRVTGVRLVRQGDGPAEQCMDADLVVDATGRGARSTVWLSAMGYQPPVEDQLVVQLKYVTQHLRFAPGALGRVRLVIIGAEPGRPSGLVLVANEHDRWALGLFGYGAHHPPSDLEGRRAFVQRLADAHVSTAHLFAAIRDAEPCSDAVSYRFPANVRRRYERVSRFPAGLVVIGDALCSFNPLYGQGMSVAAMQAVALRETLSRGDDDLARRYFRAAAKATDVAWRLAIGGDLALPEVAGPRPLSARVINAYLGRLFTAAEHDPVLVERFSRITNLLDPPAKILAPGVVRRVVAGNLRRRGAQRDSPQDLTGSSSM
jgi:2-polyprenyl-6-methoxyphenol hydroxylase-like FAD-dependent oxidoreductase